MSNQYSLSASKRLVYINAFLFGMTSISLITNIVLVNENQSQMKELAAVEKTVEDSSGFVVETNPVVTTNIDPVTDRQIITIPLPIPNNYGKEKGPTDKFEEVSKDTSPIVEENITVVSVSKTPIKPSVETMTKLSLKDVAKPALKHVEKDIKRPVEVDKTAELEDDPNKITIVVRRGDSLSKIFYRAGLDDRDVYDVSKALKKAKKRLTIHPNDKFDFILNEEGGLLEMRRQISILDTIVVKRDGKKYSVSKESRTPDTKIASKTVIIKSNLSLDSKRADLPRSLSMELADIFGWDIDFALDIRKGDSFTVLYEEKFIDDKKVGVGNIVAAKFTNKGKDYVAIRYTDKNGDTSFYTEDGFGMRKAFIRSPVEFHRISSNFQRERFHPVLGKRRPHNGTDYAAKPGTPIKASGNGEIIWRGTKGGYGKTIIIKHAGNITTLYAHMRSYAKGFKTGSKVKQDQVIGYVGSTGLATGPHLHYEFRINGVHKDPMKVKLPNDAPLPKGERSKFKEYAATWVEKLNSEA